MERAQELARSLLAKTAWGITIAFKMIFCTDTVMKYAGCHFEQIAAASVRNFERVLKRNATFATNAKAAATRQEVIAGRTMLPLGPKNPLMHSERKTLLRKVSRHTQQMAVTTEATNVQSINCMMANAIVACGNASVYCYTITLFKCIEKKGWRCIAADEKDITRAHPCA